MKSSIGVSFPAMHRGTTTRRRVSPLLLLSIYLIASTACAPIPLAEVYLAEEYRPFSPFDEPPLPLDGIDAIIQNIPAEAGESSIDGLVVLSAFINSNGNVRHLINIKSHPELDIPVAEVIRRTPWNPAKLMGEAVGVWINISVEIQSGETRVLYPHYDHPPMPVGGYEAFRRQLHYPEIANAAGIQGLVIVQAFVNKNGAVTLVVIQKGIPHTGLNEAAMEAIKNTLFTPAMLNGEAVGTWIAIPVNFRHGFPF